MNVRHLNWLDAGPLFIWRHDLETVKWSSNPPPTWEEHLRWLNAAISIDGMNNWIVEDDGGVPVATISLYIGFIYYRIEIGEVDVMVNPTLRRRGWATKAIKWLQENYSHLRATIKVGNESSFALFRRCGFNVVNISDNIVMEWHKDDVQ